MSRGRVIPVFIVIVVFAAAVALLLVLRQASTEPAGGESQKVRVVATLFPLYDMARHIGGDKADVSLLLPPGVEAHSFDPKPSDIVSINEADVFVFTGSGMEPWVPDVLKSVSNPDLTVVDASQGTRTITVSSGDTADPAGAPDPHIWLDFDNARIMAGNIERALADSDPDNTAFYERNLADYDRQLSQLDDEFRRTLSTCADREIVYGGHYAFGYLAERYGLKYISAQGVSPDAEPTASDLAQLVDQINRDGISYVFYEELTSPRIAETLSSETQARLLLLNAAHNVSRDQVAQGVTFFDILSTDLDNLKTGLQCQ